jgi:hypothetical protein
VVQAQGWVTLAAEGCVSAWEVAAIHAECNPPHEGLQQQQQQHNMQCCVVVASSQPHCITMGLSSDRAVATCCPLAPAAGFPDKTAYAQCIFAYTPGALMGPVAVYPGTVAVYLLCPSCRMTAHNQTMVVLVHILLGCRTTPPTDGPGSTTEGCSRVPWLACSPGPVLPHWCSAAS